MRKMRIRELLAAVIVGGLIAGGTAAPASAGAPSPDEAVAALATHGLLSPADGAARTQDSSAKSAALTAEGLTVTSEAGVIELTPASDAEGKVVAGGSAVVFADATASYAFTSRDGGARANAGYIVIHDQTAPARFNFRVTANGDPAVLEVVEGRVLISDQTGAAVNVIDLPWAVDADGRQVPTSYSVEGDKLVQTVSPAADSTFPVVADPRVMCDLVWCTIEFTRTETQTASETAAGASAVLCGGAALLNPIVGFACGAYGVAFWIAAVQAKNTGQCVGFRMLTLGGSAHPVIINCYA